MHYDNPPIQEALLDIQVQYSPEFNIDSLESVYDSIKETLPLKEPIGSYTVTLGPEGNSSTQGIDGYLFKAGEGDKVLQLTSRGFTYSKVNNYSTWEEFMAEAQTFWNAYIETIHPSMIKRIGVRYINKINIPSSESSSVDLGTYFKLFPESIGLNQPVESFVRYVYQEDSINCIVTHVMNPTLNTSTTKGAILDIDAFKETSIEVSSDFSNLTDLLNSLRSIKNKYFAAAITEETEALFS